MARWTPDARGRLEQAAMELYAQRGYDQTTVAEIAKRAGVTERTFFRHFADKREVLFGGGDSFRDLFVAAAAAAPESGSPLDVVAAGVQAAGAFLEEERGRDFARQRQRIIAKSPELRERELVKLVTIAAALAETLRERGVAEPTASLAAETGIAVFRVAFARWVEDGEERDLPELIRQSLAELRSVAGG
jgi:AcrR family transcriptional regulator